MKRPQRQDDEAAQSLREDVLESTKQAYKRARKAYKCDKSNEELKRAKSEAKKALKDVEAAAVEANTSSSGSEDIGAGASPSNRKREGADSPDEVQSALVEATGDAAADTAPPPPSDVDALEEAYRSALSAFKANKTDKDLRRAKTAARRALDDAIASSSSAEGATQLSCVDCSKKFLFSVEERKAHEESGWEENPKRCPPCREARAARLSSTNRRGRLDGRKRNMCYAFQRGDCPHGNHCKFSHNPEHGGKRSVAAREGGAKTRRPLSRAEESKDRKERGLRKKGKGWRNK